jgi:branched-chain amino acid transport system ATP-binding protein
MLKVTEIYASYGDLQALYSVSIKVNQGKLVALVEPNGAGKTTTLKVITRLLKLASGNVSFLNQNISKETSHKIIELGISQVPEGGRIFVGMSVLKNLELGSFVPASRKFKAESLA